MQIAWADLRLISRAAADGSGMHASLFGRESSNTKPPGWETNYSCSIDFEAFSSYDISPLFLHVCRTRGMIRNLTKKSVISKEPYVAGSFLDRGRGMIMRSFGRFDSMVFHRCNAIHTMFMSINIDVLFVDSGNTISGVRRRVVPWTPIVRCSGAANVIELPEGTIDRTGTEVGDVLDLNAELTEAEKLRQKANSLVPQAAETAIPYKKAKQ